MRFMVPGRITVAKFVAFRLVGLAPKRDVVLRLHKDGILSVGGMKGVRHCYESHPTVRRFLAGKLLNLTFPAQDSADPYIAIVAHSTTAQHEAR
jgi:hypothetical protein